jgi:hypothetical protein
MKKLFAMAALGLLGVVGCQQQPTPSSKILGTLEVQIGANGEGKAMLRPLASTPVADSAITVNTINSTYGVDANFRYVRAQVNLTANQNFSNLTLYAYNKTGNQGGTAVKNLVNFSGGNTNAEAQSLIPVHPRKSDGSYVTDSITNDVIKEVQNFQAFSSSEASSVQTQALATSVISAGETVLQYGFVAQKDATTRAFTSGDTGTINLAYRIPNTQTTDTYKFTATFVVADETIGRVSADIDETPSAALARANALVPVAPEVGLVIGADSSLNTIKSGGLRFSNLKIGTSTDLLSNMGLAVYRVGDGSTALSNAATAVFIDKFDFAGAATSSFSMPTSISGSNRALTSSGNSTAEGLMTLSGDGKCLVMTGYDAAVGTTAIGSTASSTVNRVVGFLDPFDVEDTSTTTTAFSGNSIRSAASNDCTNVWMSGGNSGVLYTTKGSSTSTVVSTTVTNLRQIGIAAGQLHVSTASGTSVRVGTIGTGLPTGTGQTITNLPGFATSGGSPYGFFFADLSNTVAGLDTLYIADDLGTIAKYSLVGGNWTANGSVAQTAARGITGTFDGSQVQLFVTNGSTLRTLTDTSGYNATITGTLSTLATAGANTAFRGVALQPR